MNITATRLYIIRGAMKGESFDLKGDVTSIGRAPDNDIQITDNSISRRHARILHRGKEFFIEDLGSQNGTWIHGHRISPGEPSQLPEGLLVAVGSILVTLGKAFSEDGMITQYSIDLSSASAENKTGLFYKNRRITNREKLEHIYEVSATLMQTLDINDILKKIMDSLFDCLKRIDNGAIILVDPESGDLNTIITKSRDRQEGFTMKYSRTIVNRVLKQGLAVMMSDTSLEDEDDLSESIEMMRIKSIMCVPLISRLEIRGVIYVHSVNVPHGFRKDDLFFLMALSSPAALAIENALLYARSRDSEESLERIRIELEKRVRQRTSELSSANGRLKREIRKHEEAQVQLRAMHDELKEANRNLGRAYAQMREWKDQLSAQLYSEEIGFLLDEKGHIVGATDKAVEMSGRKRVDLLSSSITDLVDTRHREDLKNMIARTRTGLFQQTSLRPATHQPDQPELQVKFMQVNVKESGKMLLALIRRPDRWEKALDLASDDSRLRQDG